MDQNTACQRVFAAAHALNDAIDEALAAGCSEEQLESLVVEPLYGKLDFDGSFQAGGR